VLCRPEVTSTLILQPTDFRWQSRKNPLQFRVSASGALAPSLWNRNIAHAVDDVTSAWTIRLYSVGMFYYMYTVRSLFLNMFCSSMYVDDFVYYEIAPLWTLTSLCYRINIFRVRHAKRNCVIMHGILTYSCTSMPSLKAEITLLFPIYIYPLIRMYCIHVFIHKYATII
jgi:hypothetical protein